MNDIVKSENENGTQGYTKEQYELAKRTFCKDASDDEFSLFCHIAKKRGLDMLSGQIYSLPLGGKRVSFTSIDGLRSIAHRTGKCVGISDVVYKMSINPATGREIDVPFSATVVVKKLVGNHVAEFAATAYYSEYSGGAMYRTRPKGMLGKAAESLALRKAFPIETGGLYTPEEISPEEPPRDKGVVEVEAKNKEDIEERKEKAVAVKTYLTALTKGMLPDEKVRYAVKKLEMKNISDMHSMDEWSLERLSTAIAILRAEQEGKA